MISSITVQTVMRGIPVILKDTPCFQMNTVGESLFKLVEVFSIYLSIIKYLLKTSGILLI